MTSLAEIEVALRQRGLVLRGAFHPRPEDQVPALADGRATGTLVLAGHVGASHWETFRRERRKEPDPLDRWAERILRDIADRFDARVLLPNDGPPRLPFLRWAQRSEPVHPSPLGLLIHPDYGLWHAYRGALALPERLELPPPDAHPSPCEACTERPCLRACPVGAFSAAGYDDAACARHLETLGSETLGSETLGSETHGGACFEVACLARAACPVGRDHRYPAAPARFHLEAFLRAR